MADISDVLHGLRDAIAAVLYPGGVPGGPAPASIAGAPTRIFVGFPDASLDNDLKAGVVQVSIWPRPGMARNLGPYLTGWQGETPPTPSLTVAVSGDTVTFGGTGTVPAMIAAVIVDGQHAYTYPLVSGDGPVQVAAALASLVSADQTATANGANLTIPGATSLVARVVAGGRERREMRRVQQSIQIDIWAPSIALRDATAIAIDDAMMDEWRTLDMADGTKATLTYEGTAFDEEARQQPMHRRTIFASCEYSSTRVRSVPGIAVPIANQDTDPATIRRVVIA